MRDEADRLLIVFEVAFECLALPHRLGKGCDQHRLDLAIEGDALGGVEHRLVVVEQMSGPEPLLGIVKGSGSWGHLQRLGCQLGLDEAPPTVEGRQLGEIHEAELHPGGAPLGEQGHDPHRIQTVVDEVLVGVKLPSSSSI